ncbi:DUF4431 domain-containing protein [Bdellovibrionota bacterium FG-2]
MMLITFLVFNFISGSSWAEPKAPAVHPTYYYGSMPSSLIGVIKTITFPGPPNYESLKRGDRPEAEYVLFLDEPISVLPLKEDKEYFHDPALNQRKIELVFFSEHSVKVIEGRKVRVTGTFFSAHTGHHHTDVLLEVEKIEVVK